LPHIRDVVSFQGQIRENRGSALFLAIEQLNLCRAAFADGTSFELPEPGLAHSRNPVT
jgi:hypothetical protein